MVFWYEAIYMRALRKSIIPETGDQFDDKLFIVCHYKLCMTCDIPYIYPCDSIPLVNFQLQTHRPKLISTIATLCVLEVSTANGSQINLMELCRAVTEKTHTVLKPGRNGGKFSISIIAKSH